MTPTDKTAIEAEAEKYALKIEREQYFKEKPAFRNMVLQLTFNGFLAGFEAGRTKSVEAETPHFNKVDDQQTRIKEIDYQADCIQEILDILLVGTKLDVINRYKIIRVKDLKLDSLEQPKDGESQEEKDWTKPNENGNIDVPDHLMPLMNKLAFQMRIHTISQVTTEVECIARMVWNAEKFFNQKPN